MRMHPYNYFITILSKQIQTKKSLEAHDCRKHTQKSGTLPHSASLKQADVTRQIDLPEKPQKQCGRKMISHCADQQQGSQKPDTSLALSQLKKNEKPTPLATCTNLLPYYIQSQLETNHCFKLHFLHHLWGSLFVVSSSPACPKSMNPGNGHFTQPLNLSFF